MDTTHKVTIATILLLLLVYYGSYFYVRQSFASVSRNFVVSMDKGTELVIPFSVNDIKGKLKMVKTYNESRKKIYRPQITMASQTRFLYNTNGLIYDNKLPIRYRFFMLAICTEVIFWFFYSIL